MAADLPLVRMAFICLLSSKDELTEFVGEMMGRDDRSFEEFAEGIDRLQRNLEGLVSTLQCAKARLVAAAYCAVPPDDDPGGGLEVPGEMAA